jgi:FMN reductase
MRIVGINGTLHSPSKTGVLLDGILGAIADRADAATIGVVEVLSLRQPLVDALDTRSFAEPLQQAIAGVSSADLLVVATPVYKGSYTGLLKLFVDFLGQDELVDTPIVLAATGGSELHSLVIEHELRPLFGFFRARTLPHAVYARGADFLPGGGFSESLTQAIALAADGAIR